MCDCTSGIKTPLLHAWRKRDERNTGYDWAHTAITQLAMKNAIATGNWLREGAGKRRRGTRRATAEADTRRDRRERSIQFAKYCEIIDSHNFASCLLPWNEVKPASGIAACGLPSSEKLRQSKMTGVL